MKEDDSMGVLSLALGTPMDGSKKLSSRRYQSDRNLGTPSIKSSAKSPSVRTPAGSGKKLPPSSTKSGRYSSKAAAAASPAAGAEESTEEDDYDMVQMKRLRETYSYFQSIREDMKLDDDDDDVCLERAL